MHRRTEKMVLAGDITVMTLDDQLRRYFDTDDLTTLSPDVLAAGTEHLQVDLGLERDRQRRFALWTLLHMLGGAPDLEATFPEPADRDAARDVMDMMAAAHPD